MGATEARSGMAHERREQFPEPLGQEDGVRLAPEDIEAIATRVVSLLEERGGDTTRLVRTGVLAVGLGVSEDWLRSHAEELGAIRIGDGKYGELRFDPKVVDEAIRARRLSSRPTRARRSPGRRRAADNFPLLSLPGR